MNAIKRKSRYFHERIKKRLSGYSYQDDLKLKNEMNNNQDKQTIREMWEVYLNFTRLEL